MREPLPEILPADPLPLLAQWLEEAKPVVKTPTAMALATVAADGSPTVRMVICRGFDVALGWLVFYSDRYWSTRPLDARVAAAASDQSRPIASRQAFLEKIEATRQTHGAEVPRPKRWGGYRVWAERVELWVGQPGRAHDRAVWTRALQPTEAGFTGGSWRGTRLQP